MNALRDDQVVEVVGEGALNEGRDEHDDGHDVGVLEEGRRVDELHLVALAED